MDMRCELRDARRGGEGGGGEGINGSNPTCVDQTRFMRVHWDVLSLPESPTWPILAPTSLYRRRPDAQFERQSAPRGAIGPDDQYYLLFCFLFFTSASSIERARTKGRCPGDQGDNNKCSHGGDMDNVVNEIPSTTMKSMWSRRKFRLTTTRFSRPGGGDWCDV